MPRLNDVQTAFASTLFRIYENFLPTRALYLDLEGSGGGSEAAINLFWPQNSSLKRFSWAVGGAMSVLTAGDVGYVLDDLDLANDEPKWVVVFSAGDLTKGVSQERSRVEALFEGNPFPDSAWVNLHYVIKNCKPMKASIRKHRFVWHTGETRTRYGLEALEREFKIERPPVIRSHSNSYADSLPGEMNILESIQRFRTGEASDREVAHLRNYCRADVESMFTIARECEKGLFNRRQRGKRWR